MLLPACNMHCTFCVTEEVFESIPERQAWHLVEQLHQRGVKTIVLGGGEPFAWEGDLLGLCRHARSLGMTVQIGTNGIDVPDGFEHLDEVDRWVIPLEAAEATMHDAMRLYRGQHHSIIMDRLDALKSAGKSVTISTVVTTANMADIDNLAAWVEAYDRGTEHVHAWHLYQFLPLGRGGAVNAARLTVPAEDYKAVCQRVKARPGMRPIVFKRANMYRSQVVRFWWYAGGKVECGSVGNGDS
ncbi:MAG: radical SAM protein [Planctomycetes bacterium]|nr:radical SAM protein [Planctomycetota bacterium]